MDITESRLQQNIFSKHWNQYPEERRLLFAVNNNSFNAIKGAQMKSLGVVKGVSDLYILTAQTSNAVFWNLRLRADDNKRNKRTLKKRSKN
ncbi:hypothetical protein SAMN05192545_3960 [Maribacter dokdonensis]|uniref:Uncharacterized protein n=1 Tax=Maribacter dokdonensis TaxID=320912 RepID=A0ABY0V0P3_9FLAO|nr:hypothetical protein [Maribacter dokdonensis]SDT48020.1 hypothetical protein SAMN05192545_3960 [Maribacter dokdonensis]